MSEYDHRKGSYARALEIWRDRFGSNPTLRPLARAFGLSPEEAAEVEANGYSTDHLPAPLRPEGAP